MIPESRIAYVPPDYSHIKEVWRDVKGFEGLYKVSNIGRVKGLKRKVTYVKKNGTLITQCVPETIIKTYGKKYVQINLHRDAVISKKLVHVLVAQAFIPNPKCLPEVNHIFGNPRDNYYKHLEWNTRSQNIKHSYDIGIRKSSFMGKTGRLHHASRPIHQLDLTGLFIKRWENVLEVKREIGLSPDAIRACLWGRTKKSQGYIWKYE